MPVLTNVLILPNEVEFLKSYLSRFVKPICAVLKDCTGADSKSSRKSETRSITGLSNCFMITVMVSFAATGSLADVFSTTTLNV